MSSTRLFVGNLPDKTNEIDIKDAFSKYGQIVSVDFKNKTGAENNQKKFAFVTISASNYEVESCIKHFSNEDFCGNRLFVTRARESFLERLQRERREVQMKELEKNLPKEHLPKKNPVLKLSEKLNPRKRKLDTSSDFSHKTNNEIELHETNNSLSMDSFNNAEKPGTEKAILPMDKKKLDADKKRMESIKKKRQEFREKQMIIKTGLGEIDRVANKKVIFSDTECDDNNQTKSAVKKNINKEIKTCNLFDGDESDDDVNFNIKKQYEGKKGQKILDLQSRYKSDKRFVLDERFIEDGQSEDEKDQPLDDSEDKIELGDADEKTKQLNILQDVLGITIKSRSNKPDTQKTKSKLGMLRFDPTQPEHAKFLAPIEATKQDSNKKSKKKKLKENVEEDKQEKIEPENDKLKIEVSKEQFFKVSEKLKEALVQPANFSLRSLFGQNNEDEKDTIEQETDYIPLVKPKDPKVKNPLDVAAKNPFVYDSSDSETEEVTEVKSSETKSDSKTEPNNVFETKAVWKENLFFTKLDSRLQDGLAFFNKVGKNETPKERRELKSVMKKRIYNKERKNQMFQKKIGGRKKSMKKTYRKKKINFQME